MKPITTNYRILTGLILLLGAGLASSCSSHPTNQNQDESSESGSAGSAGTDAAPGAKWSGNAVAPEVKKEVTDAEGTPLNAYYFARAHQEGDKSKAESWEQVSQTIYGSPDKAPLLKKWNPEMRRPSVGSVIYYNSPTRPADKTTMKVYAEDTGVALEQVEVKKGDTLSVIGKQRYGDVRSWKEIAALNPELKSPNQIAPGTILRLQPATAGGGGAGTPPAGGTPDAGSAPVAQNQAPAEVAPPAPQAAPAARSPSSQAAQAQAQQVQQQQMQQAQQQQQQQQQNSMAQNENAGSDSADKPADREPASSGPAGMFKKLKAQVTGMNTTAMAGAGLALAGLLALLVLKLKGRLSRG